MRPGSRKHLLVIAARDETTAAAFEERLRLDESLRPAKQQRMREDALWFRKSARRYQERAGNKRR